MRYFVILLISLIALGCSSERVKQADRVNIKIQNTRAVSPLVIVLDNSTLRVTGPIELIQDLPTHLFEQLVEEGDKLCVRERSSIDDKYQVMLFLGVRIRGEDRQMVLAQTHFERTQAVEELLKYLIHIEQLCTLHGKIISASALKILQPQTVERSEGQQVNRPSQP
jgi:hypothetical protein